VVSRLKSRFELLAKMERQRDEIAQLFLDADHWNGSVREFGEERIDADPDGQLMNLLVAMSFVLEANAFAPARRKL
jgi:hypothetical protein